jgi:hypothetical protein
MNLWKERVVPAASENTWIAISQGRGLLWEPMVCPQLTTTNSY